MRTWQRRAETIACYRRNRFWADKLAAVTDPIGRTAFTLDADRLCLDEFELELPREHAYFLDGLSAARALKAEGARFGHDASGRMRCEVGGITVYVRSLEEMYILQEIFVDGIYDVVVPGPSVVWDIGMNVGMASLYFAARGHVQVVAYEPVGPTYEMALANLDLNASLRPAITTVHGGVGASDRTELVDYCPEWKGSVGLKGAVGDPIVRRFVLHLPTDSDIRKEPLRLMNAVTVLRSIHDAHPGLPVIAKIDCEGAEYEIIDALHRSGDLGSLHALIIEWHRDGPEPLQTRLTDAGFTVFAAGQTRGLWGKIYAARGASMASTGGPGVAGCNSA